MGQITLIKRNGSKVNLFSKEPFCTVSSAVQNVTLMGDDNVQLGIKSTQFLEFAKGDKILVGGEEYSIRTKVTREILSENMYSYDAIFYGVMYELMKSQYRNCDANGKSTKSTFDLTYTLREFMHVVIYNVSRDYPGIWRFDADSCPDTDPVTLQFSKQNCLQVVQTVCKEYKYEFRIDQKDGVRILRVGKFGSKITPPAGNDFFEWGKGNGLYKLKEQKVDDKSIITRLWVEGGTQNIRSDYRDYSERLQLPYPKRLNQREHTLSDGTVIPAKSEYIGIDDDEKRYLEDPDLRNEIGSDEDTEYYDDIYPKRTGTVTALGGDIYSFVDDTMDFDLNEKDSNGTKYLINGVTAKLTFITGKLANQQFELKEKGGYVHSSRKFTLIKYTDERGMEFPSPDTDAFRFHEGDKYKITDINLPKSYEDYAEEDLWYAGYEDFKDRKQARAQYVLTFDRSYFINALPLDSETCVFHCGDYVPVKDTRYNIEKNIRIQKMSRNLLVEHDYTLTLSDTTTLSIQAQTVLDVIEHNIIIDNNRLRDLNKARRGWRTTEELRNMVYDTDGYFDVDNIKPNSIDTNMLTVGSKSQQFILIDTVLQANVNGLPNRFDATEGILAHLSIDDNAIKKWNMAGTTVILSETGGYYVFAKCSKTTDNGTFYITQEQLRVEPVSDPNNYYFQVGIIGSLHSDDNFRDFVSTYGFTRINGNTITTGKIVTSDGECYLDLDGNKFRIGDATSSIDWNVTAKNQLTLRNVKLLSDSGDLSDLGVYRGIWNANYIYYKGDEVSYTSNGATCTYRYINPTPNKGNVPTNSTYWSVVAKGQDGSDGTDGDHLEFVYKTAAIQPETPSGMDIPPKGWSLIPTSPTENQFVWMSQVKVSGSGFVSGVWTKPIRLSGLNGKDGADGTDIEFIYKATTNLTPPIKPETSQEVDYVPSGWYDNPQGVTSTCLYEWICVRYKISGVWGEFSSPVVWSKWGEKGMDGDGYEYIYKRTTISTSPSHPTEISQSEDFVPNGWTDEPAGVTSTYIYEWVCVRKKVNGVWGGFSTPAVWAKFGQDGSDGSDGAYFEYRYAKNGSNTTPPALSNTAANPSGWDTVMPSLNTLEYLWCTVAKKSTSGVLLQNWSTPVRINGVDGGKGDKGDSPATVFRGVYSNSSTYYGTKYRLDVVKYNGVYYVTRIDAGTFLGKTPTDTSKWNTFGAQFESVATELLLAENANIAEWIFKNGRLESQNGSAFLNGVTGEVKFANGNFTVDSNGNIEVNNGKFSGSISEPPHSLPSNSSINLSFDTGFNFSGYNDGNDKTVNLPCDIKYNGVRCTITNTKNNSGRFIVKCSNGYNFMYSCNNTTMLDVKCVYLYGVGDLRLRAVADSNNVLRWFIENSLDFSYDWKSVSFNNGIASPIMRIIDIVELSGWNCWVTFSADNNKPYIAAYDKGGQWWTIKFEKSRSGHKKKYHVLVSSKVSMFPYWVTDIGDEGFRVGFNNNGFLTLSSDGNVQLYIIEYS